MAAEAAANPNVNADLRSILLIAFLPGLLQQAAAKAARVEMWSRGEKPKRGGLIG
jgi:hypothetical protein